MFDLIWLFLIKSHLCKPVEDVITGVSSLVEEEVAIYNLAGQRLSKMQKGINIINGKKIIIK